MWLCDSLKFINSSTVSFLIAMKLIPGSYSGWTEQAMPCLEYSNTLFLLAVTSQEMNFAFWNVSPTCSNIRPVPEEKPSSGLRQEQCV